MLLMECMQVFASQIAVVTISRIMPLKIIKAFTSLSYAIGL